MGGVLIWWMCVSSVGFLNPWHLIGRMFFIEFLNSLWVVVGAWVRGEVLGRVMVVAWQGVVLRWGCGCRLDTSVLLCAGYSGKVT